ncbi:MAG: hypothetical protein KC609_12330 [Myxococcales bacterium]|nr:hypothetical protein [Myxococcales bacterium]
MRQAWPVLACLLTLSSIPRSAKADDVAWWLTVSGERRELFRGASVDPRGVCLVGHVEVAPKSYDSFVIRLDTALRQRWKATVGGAKNDKLYGVVGTRDGGCLAVGSTESSGAGLQDGWVVRLDAKGKRLWQKTFGGAKHDVLFDVVAFGGDFIAVGATSSKGAGAWDGWALRLSGAGLAKWEKTYGGKDFDGLFSVVSTKDGFVAAGGTWSKGAGKEDFWVLRAKRDGSLRWDKTYGGTATEEAKRIVALSDGDFVVTGGTYSKGAGQEDIWVLRLRGDGSRVWDKTFGGKGWDGAWALAPAKGGGVVVVGWTKSFGAGRADIWLIRLDRAGKELWKRLYGTTGTEMVFAAVALPKGRTLIAGYWEQRGALLDAVVMIVDDKGRRVEKKK